MRRRVVQRAILSALAICLAGVAASAVPAAAADDHLTPTAERAFTELSGCIAGEDSREVAAQFLVDESSSLKDNDPEDDRVNALRSAMSSLAELSKQLDSANKDVVVMGSTFAERYTQRQPWTTVTPKGRELDSFISSVGDLNQGQDTNYVAALAGARDAFGQRKNACKVLYWFTDGKLDMNDSASMNDAQAWNAMAKPQGLVDELRKQGVTVIALPLFSKDSPEGLRAAAVDKARLKALAEGVGTEGASRARAGRLDGGAIPESYAAGAYLESADPSVLARYFSYAVARSSGFTDIGQIRCPSAEECPSGKLRVPVESGITRTQVLLVSDGSPRPLALLGPNGESVLVTKPGKVAKGKLHDARVAVSWSGRLAKVDIVTSPRSTAAGSWTLVTDPKRPSTATLLLQSGLHVDLPKDRPPLIAGKPTAFDLSVSYADGTPVDPKAFRQFVVAAGLSGKLSPASAKSPSVYTTTVEADGQPAVETLSTRVEITTAGGRPLDPLTPSFTLRVSLPEGFPHVASLTFPEVQGDEPVTGTLAVEGAADAKTSITIGAPTLTSPDGSSAAALQLEGVKAAKPIILAAGERREIPVVFTPTAAVDGVASGSVPITLDSRQAGQQPLTQQVPFEIAMVRPVDEGQRARWVAVFAAASILIPVLFLYLVAFLLARFRPPSVLFYLRRHAVIQPDGSLRDSSGGYISASAREWSSVQNQTRRTIEVPDLRLRAGVQGFSPQLWAEGTAPDVEVAAGETPYVLAGRRGRGPASQNPHGAMYVLATDSALRPLTADPDAEVHVTVIAFTDVKAADGSIEQANGRLEAWSRGRDVVGHMHNRLPSRPHRGNSAPKSSESSNSSAERESPGSGSPGEPAGFVLGLTEDAEPRPASLLDDDEYQAPTSTARPGSRSRGPNRSRAKRSEPTPGSPQPPDLF